MKWIFIHTHSFLKTHLHQFWFYLKTNRVLSRYVKYITPQYESEYSGTAGLSLLLILSFLICISISVLLVHQSWLTKIDFPIYIFFQSFRTQTSILYLLLLILCIQFIPLFCLALGTIGYCVYTHSWRLLKYWFSLLVTVSAVVFFYILLPSNWA